MVTFYTESIDIENNETEAEEKEYIEQALCRYVNLYHLYIRGYMKVWRATAKNIFGTTTQNHLTTVFFSASGYWVKTFGDGQLQSLGWIVIEWLEIQHHTIS